VLGSAAVLEGAESTTSPGQLVNGALSAGFSPTTDGAPSQIGIWRRLEDHWRENS
jgi:hypothetical protein